MYLERKGLGAMRYAMMCLVALMGAGVAAAADATFEEIPLAPESFYNGSDEAGGFGSGGFFFNNSYDTVWGNWAGWSVSNVTDNTTPGWGNQYSAIAGGGAGGSSNYGVAFWDAFQGISPTASLGAPAQTVDGLFVTNTTYACLSMLNGDPFAKKFGGATGDDEDWFLLTIEGFNGAASTGTVDFYLADYRFADNGLDYIVDDWTWVDLTSLGAVSRVEFSLSSTDNGAFGMNTPAYFAADNFVPEPVSLSLIGLGAVALLRRRNRC